MTELERLKGRHMAHITKASLDGPGAVVEAAQEVLDGLYNSFGKYFLQEQSDEMAKAESEAMWELDNLYKWGFSGKCDHVVKTELYMWRMLLPLIASERVKVRAQQVLDRWLPKVG